MNNLYITFCCYAIAALLTLCNHFLTKWLIAIDKPKHAIVWGGLIVAIIWALLIGGFVSFEHWRRY